MSKYDKASLVHIPSGYKSGTLYNVLPNDADGDFDFTRASTATRVDENGLIETIATGTPRLNYPLIDGVVQDNPTLLLEPQRTNILPRSEDFSDSDWTKFDVSVTLQSGVSPDGTSNYYKLIEGTGSSEHYIEDGVTPANGGFSFSVFAKADDYDVFTLRPVHIGSNQGATTDVRFNLTGNGSFSNVPSHATASITKLGNGWYRCVVNVSLTGNVTSLKHRIQLRNNGNAYQGDGQRGIYVYGAQLEQGSYSTSYIPTSGSTVTRSADAANGAGTADDFNDSEGVLYANIAALANDLTYRELGISDGSTDNRVLLSYTNISNQISGTVRVGPVSQGIMNYTSSSILNENKVCIKYKLNDCSLWVNGFKVAIDTSVPMPTGLSELAFDDGGGGSDFYGNAKEVIVFNEALSDTELEALTSYDSFKEMATEQLYTIE